MPKNLEQNVKLAGYTTLGVGGSADWFSTVTTRDELREVVLWAEGQNIPSTIMGSGSNVLVPDEGVRGIVIRPNILGVMYSEIGDTLLVTAGAGVLLDNLIAELVHKKLWGLENLSAIPGTVGAVPIQNVGAYGVEVKDVIESVDVFDRATHEVRTMTNAACMFSYRDSFFKHDGGSRYVILGVTFRVFPTPNPKLSYKDLEILRVQGVVPTIQQIRNHVIMIRSKKFPDWTIVGTAGSFFKNPIIPRAHYEKLLVLYPELPGYDTRDQLIKVPLGFVLDRICGLRGYREDGVGLYEKQALVLVCDKGVSAKKILQFSEKIIDAVFIKTSIRVEREVTLF